LVFQPYVCLVFLSLSLELLSNANSNPSIKGR
jgi:hypothetical protein